MDDGNNHPIKNTEVKLDIDGLPALLTQTTDDFGYVVFTIDNKYNKKVGGICVDTEHYQSEIQKININDNGVTE